MAADSLLITAELPDLPIGVLVAGAVDLIERTFDLPVQPRYVAVSDTQHFGVQFPSEPSSVPVLVAWAERFGGTLTADPTKGNSGTPETLYRVKFPFYGVDVEAYAVIPNGKVEHLSYPHAPGSLYDCPACEAKCHCAPGVNECVYTGEHRTPAS